VNLGNAEEITIRDGVLHQQLDDETVLLELSTETYYGLDEVGTRVWQLLKDHRTIDPIVAALMAEYEVDEGTLRADVERLVGELAAVGLIQVKPAPGP
jgi:hypothetical protein